MLEDLVMKKTILVADHAQIYLRHLAAILTRMGFDVLPVEKALGIIQVLKEKNADLVLMDEDISKSHVGEILDWLKNNKSTSSIPVILISSHPHDEMENLCRLHGCVEYVKKPISLLTLHKILQSHIYTPLGYHREYIRANCFEKVSVLYEGKSYEFQMESLSEGGTYIETDSPLPLDAEVDVFLELENNFVLELKGRVVYINRSPSRKGDVPKGMAVEFIEIEDDKAHVIKDYVQGLLTTPAHRP